ncbi:MAG: M3 family peptidase, partial [Gemmatimonadetes bacterium]|nr:M3 family peptidase [Gemmatimonadota bacterium]
NETRPLRDAYNGVLPEVSAFWTRLPLSEALWERVKGFAALDEAKRLTGIRRRHLDKTMLDFRRAGADLKSEDKTRLEALKVELVQVERKFSENVLDATAVWELRVTDRKRLDGVPESHLARFRAAAAEKGLEGWLLTLDHPSVEPILKHANDRGLRAEVHRAYVSRCRDGEFDNRALVVRILALRQEIAQLLGYADYADYRLEDHMVKSGALALAFEHDMTGLTRAYWERDVADLRAHAVELGLDQLAPWDVTYVQESLRRKDYDIDDEALRPYFPLERVMDGLFGIVQRVFGLTVMAKPNEQVWHPDVRYYEIRDEGATLLGAFYSDWFPRKEKRQGAWMNDLRTGAPLPSGGFDPHLGVICGNFTPPQNDEPALLNHREVETVFHEFGHLLHHCTSRVPIRARSGLNVPWDWVELPSQFMENWCWERAALDLLAGHYRTGERLPDDLFERMVAARRYMGGWQQMRQLSFGTVDLGLHVDYARRADRSADGVMEFARERFLQFSPDPLFAELHILTSFTHLFSGGYAAGYYSYLWSEVLDADAFTRFRDEGIFNPGTGRAYLDTILSRGDSDDPERLFREFMGRDPDPGALLERNLGPAPEPAVA